MNSVIASSCFIQCHRVSSWWPSKLSSSHDVHMEMVDRLRAMLPIVDHCRDRGTDHRIQPGPNRQYIVYHCREISGPLVTVRP